MIDCPGHRTLANNALIGLCIACARQGGLRIAPEAVADPHDRVWRCRNHAPLEHRLTSPGVAVKLQSGTRLEGE